MLKEKYLKRPSPPVSAQDNPNKLMKGNDENEYVSKPNKNGIYKWHKIIWKNTAEEYYMQFPENYLNKKFYKYDTTQLLKKFKKVASELKKNNILFLEIGWKNVYYFIDYAWEEADKITFFLKKKLNQKKRLMKNNDSFSKKSCFIFYTNKSLFWSKNTGEIDIKWDLPKKDFEIVDKILKDVFGSKYIRPKNKNKAIIIKI